MMVYYIILGLVQFSIRDAKLPMLQKSNKSDMFPPLLVIVFSLNRASFVGFVPLKGITFRFSIFSILKDGEA